jgi:hypothetical protein
MIKLGSVVRLKQGDTDTLYLVVEFPKITDINTPNTIAIKAVNELHCKAQIVDSSMLRLETVSDETHKKIIEAYLLTKNGGKLAKMLSRGR